MCDTVSELAAGIVEDGQWPELLPFLFKCSPFWVQFCLCAALFPAQRTTHPIYPPRSPFRVAPSCAGGSGTPDALRESSLLIFVQVRRDCFPRLLRAPPGPVPPSSFTSIKHLTSMLPSPQLAVYVTSALSPHLHTLRDVLASCMAGGASSMGVRVASLRATISLIGALDDHKSRLPFQDMLPAMLDTLGAALTGGDEASAQEALESFVELAESDARFVRKHLPQVAQAMLSIAEAEALEDCTRHLAAEFLVTLAEASQPAPANLHPCVCLS